MQADVACVHYSYADADYNADDDAVVCDVVAFDCCSIREGFGALQPAAPLHHHRTQGRSVSATLVIYSTHTCTLASPGSNIYGSVSDA